MDGFLDLMELVSEKLAGVAQSDVVMGEPIQVGDTTIITLSRVSVGMGAGGGQGEGEEPSGKKGQSANSVRGRGAGGGMGGGGKIRPVAVVVFSPDGVKVHPIPSRKGTLDKVFDKVPELIERTKNVIEGKDKAANKD